MAHTLRRLQVTDLPFATWTKITDANFADAWSAVEKAVQARDITVTITGSRHADGSFETHEVGLLAEDNGMVFDGTVAILGPAIGDELMFTSGDSSGPVRFEFRRPSGEHRTVVAQI